MTYIPQELKRRILEKSGGCCEYCLMAELDDFFSHEFDHIVAEKHGGKTIIENLCQSCFLCNRYKGSDVGSFDPETDILTPFFHPRRDVWADHFRLEGARIVPLTAQGRVTIILLRLNDPERISERAELMATNQYPCSPSE